MNPIVLDPFSTIVQLAILANKPIGTKIYIQNNSICMNEVGFFQGVTRYLINSSKDDIQYLHNPIQFACQIYLLDEEENYTNHVIKKQKIINLFQMAKKGLQQLMETYIKHPVITLCLNYYIIIINNYLQEQDITIEKDNTTALYTSELFDIVKNIWTQQNIKYVLDIICFLMEDKNAISNVKSLETFLKGTHNDYLKLTKKEEKEEKEEKMLEN
jgi:hypothetical protein